jgi:hypothetical protein
MYSLKNSIYIHVHVQKLPREHVYPFAPTSAKVDCTPSLQSISPSTALLALPDVMFSNDLIVSNIEEEIGMYPEDYNSDDMVAYLPYV